MSRSGISSPDELLVLEWHSHNDLWKFCSIVFNSSRLLLSADTGGRYTFNRQPEICKWNCIKLAEALYLLAPMEQLLNIVESFDEIFLQHYMEGMRKKVGASCWCLLFNNVNFCLLVIFVQYCVVFIYSLINSLITGCKVPWWCLCGMFSLVCWISVWILIGMFR